MAYDTLKLKSPSMDLHFVRLIEQQCVLRSGVDLATGALLYELHSGELLGSWDSRISVRPMYEDWVTDANGRPRLAPCEPYILVEGSVHKAMLGHNVYGGPSDFQRACSFFVHLVERLLGVDLPASSLWTVHRVDVAHVYALSKPAIKEFFDSIQLRNFPRRQKKAAKYDMAVYFAGKTTTVKFYHKGSEFSVHDRGRLRNYFRQVFAYHYGKADTDNLKRADRKLDALQRLADRRLRVEVEVHSDKFQYDFGRNPLVSEVTDAYLEAIHDKEVERLLREGKQAMDTVRTTTAVMTRLQNIYGGTAGQRLYGFWAAMCTLNENVMREQYSRATFFRNRKLLEEAGVSWRSSDITVTANDSLIFDFTPQRVDRRFCSGSARNRPEFNISREELRLAA